MSVDIMNNISIVCLLVGGIFFIATIIEYFAWDMKKTIGYITGATERRTIESIERETVGSDRHFNKHQKTKDKMPKNNIRVEFTDKLVNAKVDPVSSYDETNILDTTIAITNNDHSQERIEDYTVIDEITYSSSNKVIE